MYEVESFLPLSMYQLDYQPHKLPARQKPTIKLVKNKNEERSKYRPIQMDLEILQPFKPDVNVPFSLLHQKKSIIHENPHDPIPEVKLEDKLFDLKLKARRKRAAVYLTPQISFDEIPEDIMYGEKRNAGLVASIYTSDWQKACKFAANNSPLKQKDDPTKAAFKKKDLIDKSIERTRFKGEIVYPQMDGEICKLKIDTRKSLGEGNLQIDLSKVISNEESKKHDLSLNESILKTPFALHFPDYTWHVPRLAPGFRDR